MQDIVTQFDKDLQKNVVYVNEKGTYKKYFFDSETKSFTDTQVFIKVTDLIPLFMTKCARHEMLFFCKNLVKNGDIFKYAYEEKEFRRVQCSCCEYDEKNIGTYVRHNGEMESGANFRLLTHLMKACRPQNQKFICNDLVNEELRNFLWIRPFYSDVCKKTNNIVIFALTYPENKQLQAYEFNSETQKFQLSSCECTKCTTIDNSFDRFSFGSHGIGYQRTHKDRNGFPLVCISMKWKTEKQGIMDIFCDSKGFIGKYKYNYELKCFDLIEMLDIRVHGTIQADGIIRKNPELFMDDELHFHYIQTCKEYNKPIFFAYRSKDCKNRKYFFNTYTHQFEMIKCSDCKFDSSKAFKLRDSRELEVFKSALTNRAISLKREKGGKIVKMFQTNDNSFVKGDAAPIRYLAHWGEKEILNHCEPKYKYSTTNWPIQILDSDGTERWITTGYPTNSKVFLTGMDGHVKQYEIIGQLYGDISKKTFNLVEDPDVVEEKNIKSINTSAPLNFDLPSEEHLCEPKKMLDLLPYRYTYCEHFQRILIFAFVDKFGRKRLQLLLTPDNLVQVYCPHCKSSETLKVEDDMKFAMEGEYTYEMKDSIVQKMIYDEEEKIWKVIKELEIRLLKGTENEWKKLEELELKMRALAWLPTNEDVFEAATAKNHYEKRKEKRNQKMENNQKKVEEKDNENNREITNDDLILICTKRCEQLKECIYFAFNLVTESIGKFVMTPSGFIEVETPLQCSDKYKKMYNSSMTNGTYGYSVNEYGKMKTHFIYNGKLFDMLSQRVKMLNKRKSTISKHDEESENDDDVKSTATASEQSELSVDSAPTEDIKEYKKEQSLLQLDEDVNQHDDGDVETKSSATAIEPSDHELEKDDDVKSTATAMEQSELSDDSDYSHLNDDDDYQQSIEEPENEEPKNNEKQEEQEDMDTASGCSIS